MLDEDEEMKVQRVYAALDQFSEMPGFPKHPRAATAYAIAFASFVHDKPANQIVPGHSLGGLNDLDWLCAEIWTKCEFFPKPVEARDLYENRFRPADGKRTVDLVSDAREG